MRSGRSPDGAQRNPDRRPRMSQELIRATALCISLKHRAPRSASPLKDAQHAAAGYECQARNMVSIDTWAVVLATIVGPVAAIIITRWGDQRREQRDRLFNIYRVLMATRRMNISADHVAAINLVEVEFHKVQSVIDAWSTYLTHLNATSSGPLSPVEQHQQWNDRRSELLAILISKIALHLGIAKGEIEILHGGYAPQGWAQKDDRMLQMQNYVIALSEGKAVVPISQVVPVYSNSPYPPAPAE